jgi:hypothetical protein
MRSVLKGIGVALLAGVLYVPSSGPVVGLGFWLRDQTGWGPFNYVMIPYLPLLNLENDTPIAKYIGWWVSNVFDTSAPG